MGLQNGMGLYGGGGQVKFYRYKKLKSYKVKAMLKGKPKKGFGVVFPQKQEVLAILKRGGGKKFTHFKMGGTEITTLS